ncbi:MAG TPA: NAD(P)/FAD-dependent oxidoreductase [Candidatus Acidoferrales bacterium]|nr:NAD(P)/FAD-dependent oxidoreductase [Candidatus Acidoferrales bacterium]
MESVELVVVGCGPAGATAAREAARAGIETIVLEKDPVVGAQRVCAAGLRPGFCETFDLPRSLVHCDTPRLALFDHQGTEHEVFFGPGHTTTREELDGTMGALAAAEGAQVRTGALYRDVQIEAGRLLVDYAERPGGARRRIAARNVFVAAGATARLERVFPFDHWTNGLMTTLQHRVYLDRPAAAIAYRTLELHYYSAADGREIVAWMFPKRDHLAIGLGLLGKLPGQALRAELHAFVERVRVRLFPGVAVREVKEEGHLLYGGRPRPAFARDGVLVGGTAAGLVDATNGEGIFEAAMSGRYAAEAVLAERSSPARAARRYAGWVGQRFSRRLAHRAKLMRFLERRPARYGVLFEQLANASRFAEVLQKEDHERTVRDRLYLYGQALRFAMRATVG